MWMDTDDFAVMLSLYLLCARNVVHIKMKYQVHRHMTAIHIERNMMALLQILRSL